ncbi:MAG: PorT family protein [Bacteroidales bacterium]|nr:PorT family protein [Bacteroidales bacterium]
MKAIKVLLIALVASVAAAVPAAAQFHFGPRIGTEINRFTMSKEDFKTSNRAGFTAGLMAEFTVPLVGIGCDLSAMYVHRVSEGEGAFDLFKDAKSFKSKDYIEVPLNLKYKLNLPVIGKVFCPYVFTGPSFAFLVSKKAIVDAYQNKAVDIAWNFGLGVQLFSHLQVGASYGLGLSNAIEKVPGVDTNLQPIDGKNKYWTVTAAWLF